MFKLFELVVVIIFILLEFFQFDVFEFPEFVFGEPIVLIVQLVLGIVFIQEQQPVPEFAIFLGFWLVFILLFIVLFKLQPAVVGPTQ